MSILLYAILAYLLYQFIFKLVIPIYTTTRQVKKGFREMQERMHQQQRSHSQPDQPTPKKKPAPKSSDYIDFEDVK